jgi:hypothetical protein
MNEAERLATSDAGARTPDAFTAGIADAFVAATAFPVLILALVVRAVRPARR